MTDKIPDTPYIKTDFKLLINFQVVELCIEYGVRIRQPRVSDTSFALLFKAAHLKVPKFH